MITSKEQTFKVLKGLNFNGNQSELRKEFNNLFLVVKPQKSRFGEEVYLNFGIVYKHFMVARTPKLSESLMEFRFLGVLEVLKGMQFSRDLDHSFHLPKFEDLFKKNFTHHLEKLVQKFDNLNEMKQHFPKNIPVLKKGNDEDNYTEVIYYYHNKEKLKKFFDEFG